jgi:hypothetical protein
MKSATYYRKQAANVRERADKATEDDIRARCLYIAVQFDALAEEAESEARKGPPRRQIRTLPAKAT